MGKLGTPDGVVGKEDLMIMQSGYIEWLNEKDEWWHL
jgi:hypothetical protein